MSNLFPTYNRFNLTVKKAYGTTIEDIEGNTYLDFGAGIGVCSLGHRHPDVQLALEEQLQKYWHVSNLYQQPIQEETADMLIKHSMGDRVFFCNSGSEANESAIKLARKATEKHKIISFNQSFHGRTFGAMAATGQEKIHKGFGPMLESFQYVPFNDVEAVEKAMDDETAAVMMEMIQGEGGINPANSEFVKELANLCQRNNILLIIDEVQTGIGRTGKPFAYQHYDISPDIITCAKGMGDGIPVGAIIAKESLSEVFEPGSHAATFGGNALAMAASEAVLKHVFKDDFLNSVLEKGRYLQEQLQIMTRDLSTVLSIRGKGLMIGIECTETVADKVSQLIDNGLIVLNAGPRVIRLLPPLIVTKQEIDIAVKKIYDVLASEKAS